VVLPFYSCTLLTCTQWAWQRVNLRCAKFKRRTRPVGRRGIRDPELCLHALNIGADVCGWGFRERPIPHFSEHAWWATCALLSRLDQPRIAGHSERSRVLHHDAFATDWPLSAWGIRVAALHDLPRDRLSESPADAHACPSPWPPRPPLGSLEVCAYLVPAPHVPGHHTACGRAHCLAGNRSRARVCRSSLPRTSSSTCGAGSFASWSALHRLPSKLRAHSAWLKAAIMFG
jgi:hypothetical protein